MTTTTSTLLADPAQVALIRDLYAHARTVRAEHALYAITNGRGLRYVGVEHTWTVGHDRVLIHDGWLLYQRRNALLLKVQIDTARQVGQLLAAIGVLPERFIAPAAPTNPDRRCRHCGATSGLKALHTSPLTLAAKEWQCWDGCRDSAR